MRFTVRMGEELEDAQDRQEDAAEKLKAATSAVDQGAKAVSTFFAGFLVFSAYVVVTVASTTDLMLLLESPLKLPVIDVGIPLHGFYGVVPIVLVLLHINLLLHIWMLSTQVLEFEGVLRQSRKGETEEVFAARRGARRMLYPFMLTRALLRPEKPEPPAVFFRLAYFTTVIALPVATLLFIQLRFLPYHDEQYTWLHRSCVVIDLLILVAFKVMSSRLAKESQNLTRNEKWRRRWRLFRSVVWSGVCAIIFYIALFFFTVPGEYVDVQPWALGSIHIRYQRYLEAKVAEQADGRDGTLGSAGGLQGATSKEIYPGYLPVIIAKVGNRVHRNLVVLDSFIGKDLPSASELARMLVALESEDQEERSEARRWLQAIPRLKLKTRNLRNALFVGSTFINTDFDNVQSEFASYRTCSLYGVRIDRRRWVSYLDDLERRGMGLPYVPSESDFTNTDWSHSKFILSDLRYVDLQGANFWDADLRRANCYGVDLRGATLGVVRLQGADLQGADLRGADLRWASLQGANLAGASLQGANLARANLRGADLSSANLIGADLEDADLQGAGFQGASLQGASLQGADLRGADLSSAGLQAANLDGADLRGAILWWPNMFGAIGSIDVSYSYIGLIWLHPPDGETIFEWRTAASEHVNDWAEIEARIRAGTSRKWSFRGAELAVMLGTTRMELELPPPDSSIAKLLDAHYKFLLDLAKEDGWVALRIANTIVRQREITDLTRMLDKAYQAGQISLPTGHNWPLNDYDGSSGD